MQDELYRLTWDLTFEDPATIIDNGGPIQTGYHTFNFEVDKPSFVAEHTVLDLLHTNVAIFIFSDYAKTLIEREKHPEDMVRWHPCEVKVTASNSVHTYHIFDSDEVDFLDYERSEMKQVTTPSISYQSIVRPVFDMKKVGEHKIFRQKGVYASLVISREMMVAMKIAKCTGFQFRPVEWFRRPR